MARSSRSHASSAVPWSVLQYPPPDPHQEQPICDAQDSQVECGEHAVGGPRSPAPAPAPAPAAAVAAASATERHEDVTGDRRSAGHAVSCAPRHALHVPPPAVAHQEHRESVAQS